MAISPKLKFYGTVKIPYWNKIIEWNGWKIWTHDPMYCIYRLLFIFDSMSSVGLIRCIFVKCPMVIFSKEAVSPSVFIQFQPNVIVSMLVMKEYWLLHFWPKLKKIYGTLKVLFTHDHIRWKFQNAILPIIFSQTSWGQCLPWWNIVCCFSWYSAKLQAITLLAICKIAKVYGTLKSSYLSYIAIIHKAMFLSSGKGQAPWASC